MDTFRPGGLETTEIFTQAMGLHEGLRVLDVGCGLGESLRYMKNTYAVEAFGVDLSAETVRRAGESYISVGDACTLDFPDESFGAVFFECVLSLIAEPELAINEAYRVLKSGGYLAISTLSYKADDRLLSMGRINTDSLMSFLERQGFEIIFCMDEKRMLIEFIAEMIFRFGSIEAYCIQANKELGSSVISCDLPIKDTGYTLILAKKK